MLDSGSGNEANELFFTHCGGKARMPMVVRALRALDVPVVVISDLDLLREEARARAVVEALGRDWGAFARDWNIVNAAVGTMSAAPAVADVRTATSEAIDEAVALGPRLTADASEKIRKATKVEGGWAILKRAGISALPHGDPTAAALRLSEGLREIGLFLVPVGELEGWHADVPHRSSAWLGTVLSEERHRDPGAHHEYVDSVRGWFEAQD